MSGFRIPLEVKIDFLEYVVIPSFGVTLHPPQTRESWMREIADKNYDRLDVLMNMFNTVTTLEQAHARLEKEEAKFETERQFLLQQGD